MVAGAGGGDTVNFAIRAIADLTGIKQTAAALTGLGKSGAQVGQGVTQSTKQAGASLQSMQTRADAAAHSLRGIAAASAGILGVGVALFKVGASFDEALDTIRVGTGATGKALTDLGNDARAVFREVPASLQTIATALTELQKRTGDTGKSLQELTKAEIELAEITKTDLNQNIADTSKLFEQWGISVDEQVPTLDKLFRASQATGISVDTLAASLTQYGPILRTMGFGLDQSIALLATLDKAGVNTGQVITGLRTAIAKFSAAGVTDLGKALEDVFSQIKNAPSDVAAATIAIDTFGSRAGPALAESIRSGKLSYEDLIDTVSNGNETISQATADTQDFAEKMHILRNRATDALIPLGTQMFNALNALIPAMSKVAQGVEVLGEGFGKLPGPVKAVVAAAIVAIGAVAGISLVTSTVAGIVTTAAGAVVGLATSMGLISATAPEAAASIAAVGIAAEATTVAVTELAVAEDAAAVSSVAAGTRIAVLTASLAKLAQVAAAGIIITVGGSLLIDAAQSSKAGTGSDIEGIANKIVEGVADGIRQIGGEKIADALDGAVQDAQTNLDARDLTVDLGFTINKGDAGFADNLLRDTVKSLPGGSLIPDDWIPDIDHTNDKIEGLNVTIGELQKRADESHLSIAEELIRAADAAGVTTPELEKLRASMTSTVDVTQAMTGATEDSTAALDDQTASLSDQVDAQIKSKQAQDELTKAVQATQNAQFLASAAGEGLLLPFTRNADNAQDATEKFNKTLEDMQSSAITAAQGLGDIAPELDGLQTGFGKAGDSVVDLFRKMDDAGVVNFSPAVRQALDLVSALDKVEANIADVEAAITNNQGDLSMWQGRISLVTDTFGANSQVIGEWTDQLQNGSITQQQFNDNIAGLAGSGGFPKLDALLAQGKISTKEYGDAVAAGTHLLQRSTGALQDEGGELVRNIIALDKWVSAHDDADGAVNNLSDSQRGFIAAMSDSKVQTYLQTLQLLFYLATIGQIPQSKVTEFIVDSGKADPVIAAVNQDLGLIPGEKSVVISATVNDAIFKLKEVQGVLIDTTADGATITVSADTSEAAQKFLDLNEDELSKLDGRELVVKVKGDDGEWQTVRDEVIGDEIPDKTVKITAQGPDALPFATPAGIPINAPSASVTQTAPVVLTAEDQITPVVDDVNTTLTTFQTDATNIANATGQAIGQGLQTGFQIAAEAAAPAISTIVNSLNIGNLVYNYGFNDGYNFGVGFANGITATAASVFNAAFNVGYMAHLGTQAGMDAHSPSRLAAKDGQNWVESFVSALNNGKQSVRAASADLSAQMQIGAVPINPMQSMVRGDRRAQSVLAATSAGGSVHSSSHVVHINLGGVHGVTDPAAVSERVITDLYRSLDRQDAAGLFRR